MNREAVLAIVVLALFVLTVSTPQFVESANAIRKPDSIGIEIQSPLDNATFNSSVLVALKVELVYGTATDQYYTGLSKQDITCKYSLDNGEWVDVPFAGLTLNRTQWDLNFPFINLLDFTYNTTLQELSAGTHSINFTTSPFPQDFVFSYDAGGHFKKMPSQVYFNVSASQTVKADSTASIDLTYGSYNPHVNERVELTATINGWGTPPYTYQWYTVFIPQDVLDRGFILPGLVKVAVPGATSSTFEFIESTPGTYNINLQIIDSAGNDRLISSHSFITVQASPSPTQQNSPATLPSPSPTLTPTNSVLPSISLIQTPKQELQPSPFDLALMTFFALAIVAAAGFLAYHKKHKHNSVKKLNRKKDLGKDLVMTIDT